MSWRFLIEQIGGIAVLAEEGQADGTLLALPQQEMLCAYAIGLHKLYRLPSHDVCSRIADEGARHACPPHADDAVEAASAMHSRLGLPVAEEDVKDGLAHPNYFPLVFHCPVLAVQS